MTTDYIPFAMVAALLNALVIGVVFRDQLGLLPTMLWVVCIALGVTRMHAAWHVARIRPRQRASQRTLNRITIYAAVHASLWGSLPIMLFAEADATGQIFLVALLTGLLCAGAFILASVREAAIIYVATLGLLSAGAIAASGTPAGMPIGLLLLIYTVSVSFAVVHLSNNVVSRLVAETQGETQQHVIGLLLKDFEEHASDILWEMDENGTLRHASPRLLEVLGIAEHATTTLPFLDLLARVGNGSRQTAIAFEALAVHFAGTVPFRDFELNLGTGDRSRWWTITAKPLVSEVGHVVGWRGILADVTATRDTRENLVKLAHHCSLTGLANRHHFVTRLTDEMRRLHAGSRLAVLYIDLDDFKKVNDSFGHAHGDALLRNIADRLQLTVRESDLVARLGGDEFAIMLHDVRDESHALGYAQRLLDFIEPAYKVDGVPMPVGMSIGLALAPEHGQRADELMRAADLAMYAAKSAGKGAVRLYSLEMGESSRRRRIIEDGLRTAIASNQLKLVYQPQVAIDTGQIKAFEALLRWEHPTLGHLAPAEFIPIAEETGQIDSIGSWVVHQACDAARDWPANIGVAINVSATQTLTDKLARSVVQALRTSGLNVRRLELEITESIFLDDDPDVLRNLHELRDLGVKIALDDFGVGYSSLAYLRRFPFNSLKIDRAFVQEMVTSDQSRSIVRAIVALASCLGMIVIAEGVERREQQDILTRMGADWAQGYLYSEPVAAQQVLPLLARWEVGKVQRTLVEID